MRDSDIAEATLLKATAIMKTDVWLHLRLKKNEDGEDLDRGGEILWKCRKPLKTFKKASLIYLFCKKRSKPNTTGEATCLKVPILGPKNNSQLSYGKIYTREVLMASEASLISHTWIIR